MFKPFSQNSQRAEGSSAVHTLLGSDTHFRGEVQSGAMGLRVEGHFEGTIRSEGEVSVAVLGSVVGTIMAKHLIVAGRVEGTVKVEGCLEIQGTGWVEGEVEVSSLIVDEGGTFQGSCSKRGTATKEAPVVPPNTAPLQRLGAPTSSGLAASSGEVPPSRQYPFRP